MKKYAFLLVSMFWLACPLMTRAQVDTRIPLNQSKNDNTFVVIISNENYKYEQSVPFANNDGDVFGVYCEKALGIPADHILRVSDATRNDINHEIDLLTQAMDAFDGQASAIVYYSGHGMPDEASGQAYLLPVDGYASDMESGISLNSLYDKLGNMQSRFTLVLLDACFSGAGRDGNMVVSARSVARLADEGEVKGNMVVFSAAQGTETAYPYSKQKHGMFTYYLLQKIQQTGGKVSLGELSDYVISNVRKQSIVSNHKSQTPTITASSSLPNWRKWELATVKAKTYVNRAVASTTPTTTTPTTPTKPTTPTTPTQPSVTTQESEATKALNEQGKRAMRALNYEKARQCFAQTASQGSAEGNYQLGMLYSNNNYDGYDKDTAISYFLKAAQSNHAEAMYRLGLMYLGTDNDKAQMWFKKAVQHGNKDAQKYLKTSAATYKVETVSLAELLEMDGKLKNNNK